MIHVTKNIINNVMKVKLFAGLLLSAFLVGSTPVLAQETSPEAGGSSSGYVHKPFPEANRQAVATTIELLVAAVNKGDVAAMASIISPSQPELLAAIQDRISGGVTFDLLDYTAANLRIQTLYPNRAVVYAAFSASGPMWNMSGETAQFVLQQEGEVWLITETNFHENLNLDYVTGGLATITIVVVIFLVCLFIGAILYYFLVMRRKVTSKR